MNESTKKDPTKGPVRARSPQPRGTGAARRPVGASDADASVTRERLLGAGRRLFAVRGFRGTSIRALTAEAGANLGAVTYHFESKEGLYRAVLEECMGPMKLRLDALSKLPVPAMARVELFVRGMFQHLLENPDMPRFMVQELVVGERPAREVLDTMRSVVGTLASLLEEGQADGSIVPGDPVLQALTILSQPIYLSVIPAVLKREDLRSAGLPVPRRSAENHAVALLRRALALREEENE